MRLKKLLLVLLMSSLCSMASAGGNDFNYNTGSRSFTLNGLYFAGSAGLSTIQSNPAGIVYFTGKAFEISILDNIFQSEFDGSERGLFKSYREDNFSLSGGLIWNFGNDIAAGISYHPVIDSRIDWPFVNQIVSDSSTVTLAFSMLNRLEVNSISPTVAFKLGALSIGITANIYQVIQQISFPRSNPSWEDSVGLAAYQFSYNLDGFGYGGTLGLMYDLSENVRIGVSARSGAVADIDGDAKSNLFADVDSSATSSNVTSEFEIPWRFGAGALLKLNEEVAVNIDAAYTLWGSTQESISYTFENTVWQNGLSSVDPISGISGSSINLNYDNAIQLGAGIEYTTPSIIYRAGYRFSQVQNSESTYNFLFPEVSSHTFSLGIGYRSDNLTMDAGIAYSFGMSKEISSDQNPFISGEYSTGGYIPSLSIRYDF